MPEQEFGTRLRELRRQAGMTQKELAGKVGIDFTYLSKIENGVMPPPSEKVILKLVEVLNADKDELITLAGRVPADIAKLLSDRGALQLLRSPGAQKMIGASGKIRRNLRMPSRPSFTIHYRGFAKVAIAIALVLALGSSLWFASPLPVKAVTPSIPDLPTVMYTGHTYSFYVQVDIDTHEEIPVESLRLNISGPSPAWVVFNTAGAITSQSSASFGVTIVTPAKYGYGYRYGYGYGYQPPPTGYRYFSHWWGWGYGYGYGYGASQTTQAKYLVSLNTAGMSTGSYTAQFDVNTGPGEKKFVSSQYSFTIATSGGGGAPTPTPTVVAVGSVDLTANTDAEGNTTVDITLSSSDGDVTIVILKGTKVLDAQGNPLSSIEIIVLHTPPPPPGYVLVGPAYDCRPEGATFDPALNLTFAYDQADVPAGTSETNLVMAYWDEATSAWTMLPTTVNTVGNTVTAEVSHFTAFAILANVPSPAFTVDNLTVSPTRANVGQTVTITVIVRNSGDASGSYSATLKVNATTVDTKEVTLPSGTSQTIVFTTTEDAAGTYTVDVNGLTSEFVVRSPAAFETSELSISPTIARIGEAVNISTVVTNVGQVEGSYAVTLKIDGAVEATKEVTLAGGQNTTVTFTVGREAAGSYQIDVDGQTGSFTITQTPLAWWVWLIAGLVAVVIIVVIIVSWLRRRAY